LYRRIAIEATGISRLIEVARWGANCEC